MLTNYFFDFTNLLGIFSVTFVSDSLDLSGLGDVLSDIKPSVKKSPHSFLGENSSLVNLDNLVTISPKPAPAPVPQGKTHLARCKLPTSGLMMIKILCNNYLKNNITNN